MTTGNYCRRCGSLQGDSGSTRSERWARRIEQAGILLFYGVAGMAFMGSLFVGSALIFRHLQDLYGL